MSANTELASYAAQPFELLRQMEQRARKAEVQVQQTRTEWLGVGVSIDGVRYVISQEQILEVLKKPATTRVPGARRWMLGLSNVRGTLFPVIDVRLYCGDEPTVIGRDSRVVLINMEAAPVGIVVDEVYGFRRFPAKMSPRKFGDESPLNEYVLGSFSHDELHWAVIDIVRLIETGGVLTTTH